jgi:hypothetical protein
MKILKYFEPYMACIHLGVKITTKLVNFQLFPMKKAHIPGGLLFFYTTLQHEESVDWISIAEL